ncbi:GAF and ANTAR domain-containing protein [Streptomyces sp. NPDC004111]|uniref:GAF and ANTAR domain-containing protein n=1 Tax=Streptomyces sp. NPDC004111 TaxID=3364690 RepID=UPI0036C0CFFA
MDSYGREQKIATAFVEATDTLVDDFDVIDFLHWSAARCVELLDVSAAGLMLTDQRGQLRAVASSDERARLFGLLEIQQEEGPCLDCFRGRRPVAPLALSSAAARERWPVFAPRAAAYGFGSTYAVPLRLRETVIGALNLFAGPDGAGTAPQELQLAQALADTATLGVLQQRTVRHDELLAGQVQSALTGRVRLDQAKGMLAEQWGLSVDEAFDALRSHAERAGRPVSEVAMDLVRGSLDVASVPAGKPGGGRSGEQRAR